MNFNPRTFITIFFLILLVVGCRGISTTPISTILDDPRGYNGKLVAISGEVTEVFGLLGIKYFMLEDGTGEIPVITTRPLPKKGTSIKVRGTVTEAFAIGDSQLMVIVEKE